MNKLGNFITRFFVLFFGTALGLLMFGYSIFAIYFVVTNAIEYFSGTQLPSSTGTLIFIFIITAPFGLILPPFMLLDIFTDIKKVLFRKKCPLCSKIAYDTLTADKKIGEFCRIHLIEKYSQLFKESHFNEVMVEYQPQGVDAPSYYYYPVSEIDFKLYTRYSAPTKDDIAAQDTIKHLLDVIKAKKCQKCSEQATILFIPKEVHPFSKYRTTPRREEFETKGEYFCKEHALDKIIPSIKNSSKHFDTYEGLCLPRKEDGYQATVAF